MPERVPPLNQNNRKLQLCVTLERIIALVFLTLFSMPAAGMAGEAPSALAGTSPKWDHKTYTIFIKNFHVPFGGGRVGAGFAVDSIK